MNKNIRVVFIGCMMATSYLPIMGQSDSHQGWPIKKTVEAVVLTGIAALSTRIVLPPVYRVARTIRFNCMSQEARMKYAREFYYKVATFYVEAINKGQRNEADLQTIVASGIQQLKDELTIGKRLWRWLDYEWLNRSKKRAYLSKYPFLYYENKLRNDIQWLDFYIDHLQVDGPHDFARKKQEMRNLVADLKRLHVEIKRSHNYAQQLQLKKEADKKAQEEKYIGTFHS